MLSFLKNPRYVLLIILCLTIWMVAVDLPLTVIKIDRELDSYPILKWFPESIKNKRINIDTRIGGYSLDLFNSRFQRDLEIKKGLDISGGVSVLLEADMTNISESERDEAVESLRNVIERRVNLLGISEANVQTSKSASNYRVIVDLAGVFDTEQALNAIGKVANLDFKVFDETKLKEGEDPNSPEVMYRSDLYTSTGLTGAQLKKAQVAVGAPQAGLQTGEPQVEIQFDVEGTKKFRDLTKQYLNKRIAIFLDDNLLINPEVISEILDGKAAITGGFTLEGAKTIAAQLNAGALPVPVKVLRQQTIGPSLGNESVSKSVSAGLIGLALVCAFMILYYGRLGILACIALIIYGIITLALYKLVPIVLTLPGLAGFILSIGMAVDANILIFERIKEEIRANKPLSIALENGFGRAWGSIRDANTATLMTAFILFNPFDWSFLPTSGLVRGFALNLAVGILISLFTGVFVSRNLVRVFYAPKRK